MKVSGVCYDMQRLLTVT